MINSIARVFRRLFSKNTGIKQTGTIKFFDKKKRFGFIIAEKQEYFFHASSAKPQDFKRLRDGAKVSFVVIEGKKGAQADKIEFL